MFHKNLDKLITERGEKKLNLSRLIGVSRTTLDDYLAGRTFMPSDKIEIIAAHFGVSVGSLFGEVSYVPDEDMQKLLSLLPEQKKIMQSLIHTLNKNEKNNLQKICKD